MKYLDWQQINPSFVEAVASTRFATEASNYLGLTGQGLPQEAQIKAAIAELLNAVALLGGNTPSGTTRVILSPTTLSVLAGATVQCTVTVLDGNGQPVNNATVALTS